MKAQLLMRERLALSSRAFDHKHVDEVEVPYQFSDLDRLQADFWADVHVRRK
jgi:hypothetical protein